MTAKRGKAKSAAVAAVDDRHSLRLTLKAGERPVDANAKLVASGIAANAVTVFDWTVAPFNVGADITATVAAVSAAAERVKAGGLGEAEGLLMAQAVTLNALFTQLAARARAAQYLDQLDRYLRLAMKAQAQCRATLDTLATLKNPPTVIARQANITSGPQQVNSSFGANPQIPACARLEPHHADLDIVPPQTAERGDTELATMGAFDRPPHP